MSHEFHPVTSLEMSLSDGIFAYIFLLGEFFLDIHTLKKVLLAASPERLRL